MANKKRSMAALTYSEPPQNLVDHPFYGLVLDEEQIKFRDAIWNPDKKIVFCDARAGTGKTTIAFATANLMVKYGLYDGIIYIASPYGERRMGYLPGDLTTKSQVYFEPLYNAAITCGVNPNVDFNTDPMLSQGAGGGYVTAITHTFLRGTTLGRSVIILDESQNYTFDELKKTLTRATDTTKVVVVGHHDQCDINHEASGFVRYMNYFRQFDEAAVCELHTNYRGWVSNMADAYDGRS